MEAMARISTSLLASSSCLLGARSFLKKFKGGRILGLKDWDSSYSYTSQTKLGQEGKQ